MASTPQQLRPRIEIHRPFGFLSLAYMGGIAALSLSPELSTAHADPIVSLVSNLLHMPAYAGLAYCLFKTFRVGPRGSGRPHEAMLVAVLIAAAFGAASEWAQVYVPGRYASLNDFFLDLVGALAVIVCLEISRRRHTAQF